MGALRNVALAVLAISFLTFVAFFGRLPSFRRTPIGFLHRLLWIHIPSSFRRLDARLTNGRLSRSASRLSNYLLHEKHPLVLIFFLTLLTGSAALFLPVTWFLLSTFHRTLVLILLPLPYLFTHLCARPAASRTLHITPANLSAQLSYYPYDRILFHPNNICRTCGLPKPARSKHCSICKACVARADHHCVWVNNCLGRGNYRWFLALLLSSSVLLAYGAYLAYVVLAPMVRWHFEAHPWLHRASPSSSTGPSVLVAVKSFFSRAVDVFLTGTDLGGLRIAGVGLLATLTAPLPLGLLAYHVYLIWAGMTTNENAKWADWKEDMAEGIVFLGRLKGDMAGDEADGVKAGQEGMSEESGGAVAHRDEGVCCASDISTWPVRSYQILVRTSDGEYPRNLPPDLADVVEKDSWTRCWKLAQVENIYDLGFWDNLKEVLWN